MNIQEIAEEVCDSLNLHRPNFSITNSFDANSRQFMALIHEIGRDLRNTKAFTQLRKIHKFSTVNGQSNYPLPNDFFCKSLDCEWDVTNKWKLLGPTSDSNFNEKVYGYVELENRKSYRLFGVNDTNFAGGQFYITPVPGPSTSEIYLEYTSKNFILPRTWEPNRIFSPGDLNIVYCFSGGRIYFSTLGGVSGGTPPTHSSGIVSDGGISWEATPLDFLYEKALDSYDRLVFEDEVVLLGVKYKFLESKGLDYSDALNNYEKYKQTAISRWQGNKRINLAGSYLLPSGLNPNVPDGNWSV